MTSPSSFSPRLRRPGWRDPRLLIGVLLVCLSVFSAVLLIRSMDSRQEFWVASSDLAPGKVLTPDDFKVAEVNLGEIPHHYWPASEDLPTAFAVSSNIREGELLTKASVSEGASDLRQQTAVRISEQLPEGLGTGSRVDLWVSHPRSDGHRGFEEPELTAEAIEIAGINEAKSTFNAANYTTIFVLLSSDILPQILDAQTNGAEIHVVPARASDS